MKLRGALYGCGMISEFHLRGWQRIPEVEIVALANRTEVRAEEKRNRFAPGARIYGDLPSMLAREELDFIDILTIPELHREHCLVAQNAGLHIICQKPLCDTFEAARDLAARMRCYPKLFAVHENHRYRPWFRGIREKVKDGCLGAPVCLYISQFDAREPAEAYKNEAGTGVFLEYGSHLVDMMRSILGEPRRVYARMHHVNSRVKGESLVHAVYEFPDCTAVIDVGWKPSGVSQGGVLLLAKYGEVSYDGTLTRGENARLRVSKDGSIMCDTPVSPYDEYVESFYLFERECADAMLGRGSVVQTGEQHLKTLACTFAAYRSAEANAPVALD